MGYPVAMNLPDNAGGTETQVQILGLEDPLKKEMATHSSNLAWKIPWTEEPGGLQSMGSQESDMTEHAHTTQQTSLKDISSFCSTTYTFTVI